MRTTPVQHGAVLCCRSSVQYCTAYCKYNTWRFPVPFTVPLETNMSSPPTTTSITATTVLSLSHPQHAPHPSPFVLERRVRAWIGMKDGLKLLLYRCCCWWHGCSFKHMEFQKLSFKKPEEVLSTLLGVQFLHPNKRTNKIKRFEPMFGCPFTTAMLFLYVLLLTVFCPGLTKWKNKGEKVRCMDMDMEELYTFRFLS